MSITIEQKKEVEKMIDQRIINNLQFLSKQNAYTFPILDRFYSNSEYYNSHLIYCFSMLSNLSYSKEKEIKQLLNIHDSRWIQGERFKFFNFKASGTQLYIISDEKDIVITYRGTESDDLESIKEDWQTNLKLSLVDFSDYGIGKVHQGFFNAFLESWEHIKTYLIENQSGSQKRIWINGHSLGGAIATICFAAMINEYQNNNLYSLSGLYTFGQPKVGNKLFKNNFKGHLKKVIRVQNCIDPVTFLPPYNPFKEKYVHISKEKTISWKGEFRAVRSKRGLFWDRVLGSSRFIIPIILVGFIKKSLVIDSILKYIEQHSLIQYIEKIKKSSDRRLPKK